MSSICGADTDLMEVSMSRLVRELEDLCQHQGPGDCSLSSVQLFLMVVASLTAGVLLGVVGVACFKHQVPPGNTVQALYSVFAVFT